jgi:cytochrome P450
MLPNAGGAASEAADRFLLPLQGMAQLPKATNTESLAFFRRVVLPPVAKGVIIRRPRAVRVAQKLDLDRRGVRYMQRLRERYGHGPLLVGGRYAVIFDPAHARRVLDETPEPFATETPEKRAALAHFEPRNVLISHGAERAERRRFHEQALDTGHHEHRLAGSLIGRVREETARLLTKAKSTRELAWPQFADVWSRIVRLVVFGEIAREDAHLSAMTTRLRRHANWAFLHRKRKALRAEFLQHIDALLARAEPGSLAAAVAMIPRTDDTAPADQVAQWLFAFDPAGMTTYRALALLSAHGAYAARLDDRELLRAAVHDAVRLFPTTPLVLRETTAETSWDAGVLPAKKTVLIFTPFFHRDETRLPFADRFTPEVWASGEAERWTLIPFSAGPATCPARELVLFLGSEMLATLFASARFHITSSQTLDPGRPLPGTLNHFRLRFAVES